MSDDSLHDYPAGLSWMMESASADNPDAAETEAVMKASNRIDSFKREAGSCTFSDSIRSINHTVIFDPLRNVFVASVTVWFINPLVHERE